MISHEPNAPSVRGRFRASPVSIICFLRGLPLFFSATPKTPLRVLCLIAFDTVHVLRTAKPLPRQRIKVLASVLDLAASANAAFDDKIFFPQEYMRTRRRITLAKVTSTVDEYLSRLRQLEQQRPSPGGGRQRFNEVRSYRESVARLSLGAVATIALGDHCVEAGIRATHCDDDLAVLFRIVMLCQIIDDVLDCAEDVSAGLPSFLTAATSLAEGLGWTVEAARSYGRCPEQTRSARTFPLRLALAGVLALTTLVLRTHHLHRSWSLGRARNRNARTLRLASRPS